MLLYEFLMRICADDSPVRWAGGTPGQVGRPSTLKRGSKGSAVALRILFRTLIVGALARGRFKMTSTLRRVKTQLEKFIFIIHDNP